MDKASALSTRHRPRVLLADDYRRMLGAWRRFLSPTCEIVGEVSSGVEVVDAVVRLAPDVIVLDIAMPGLSGLDACRLIRNASPRTRVVLVTAADDVEWRAAALQAGASAFVVKYAPTDELESAIQRAFRGSRPTDGEAEGGAVRPRGTG